jgi:hypothetical protein
MNHAAALPLQWSCSRVQAVFADPPLKLENRVPLPLLWDEHGGTYVLRVVELYMTESTEAGEEAGFRAEISLPPEAALLRQVEEFASQHSLPLAPVAPLPAELTEEPILSACHIPAKTLFIFSEDSRLRLRAAAPQTLELAVSGSFKSRRIPSQETDLVIHLTPAAATRLLSFLRSLARESR